MAIHARRNIRDVQLFEEFSSAIGQSRERVWIIDKHLFDDDGEYPDHEQRCLRVAGWFEYTQELKSVQILTSAHASKQNYITNKFQELQEVVLEVRGSHSVPIDIKVRFSISSFPYIHDRFAIVDNELWHFGATVGGFHRDVNAASRGWNVENHKALEFFNLAWTGNSDLAHKQGVKK